MKNLLKHATSLIPMDTILYSKFTSDTANDVGLDDPAYAAATKIKANIQSVSRQNYIDLGLDLNKKYVTIFTHENMQDVDRDKSGDRFVYNGETYEILSGTEWLNKDGWNYYTAVRID